MTKTSKLSMIVFLLCLSACLIHVPSVFASSESLYVDAFSAAVNGWVHSGSTPWLDNNNSYSSAYTDHVNDSAYGFANTAISDFSTITSIKLKGEAKTNNELNYAVLLLYGSNGGAWSSSTSVYGDGTTSFIAFESSELKTTVNSLARINEALLNLTKHNAGGAGTLTLRRVYLAIVYTAASTTFTIFSSTAFSFNVAKSKSVSFSEHIVIPFAYLEHSSKSVIFQENALIPFQFLESSGKSVLFNPLGSMPLNFIVQSFAPWATPTPLFVLAHHSRTLAIIGVLACFALLIVIGEKHREKQNV